MRYPNPWIVGPSLLAGGIGGFVGWVVTDVSCRVKLPFRPVQTCTGWVWTMATVGFLVGFVGMLTVMILVSRSIAEHRQGSTPA